MRPFKKDQIPDSVILDAIKNVSPVNCTSIGLFLGIRRTSVHRRIQGMIKKGLLEPIQPGKRKGVIKIV